MIVLNSNKIKFKMFDFRLKIIDDQLFYFRFDNFETKYYRMSIQEIKYILLDIYGEELVMKDSEFDCVNKLLKHYNKNLNTQLYFIGKNIVINILTELSIDKLFKYEFKKNYLEYVPFIFIHDRCPEVMIKLREIKDQEKFILTEQQWDCLIDNFFINASGFAVTKDLLCICDGIFYMSETYTVIKTMNIISNINWNLLEKDVKEKENLHKEFKNILEL